MAFQFYPTFSYGFPLRYLAGNNHAVLLPASSWARGQRRDGSLPTPVLADNIAEVAADCGGFVATKKWGEYRYSPAQYVNWLEIIGPKLSWAATMDYCCEPPIISGQQESVVWRQLKTTMMAWLFWDEYRHSRWVWTPTIQGWGVEDYIAHAQELKPLIEQMQVFYTDRGQGDVFRVGIGTLCARASNAMINAVVEAMREILPTCQFHLWGVKLDFLASEYSLANVISSDSAAYDPNGQFGGGTRLKSEMRRLGYSQRQYVGQICLPDYIQKVKQALDNKPASIQWRLF